MLSVLSVDEVERQLGEVPVVESVTVNFAAGNATMRYDETRLEVADINSAVGVRVRRARYRFGGWRSRRPHGTAQQDKATPASTSTPASFEPNASLAAPAAGPDHPAHMAADFRKRFWISPALSLRILVLSPMHQSLVGLRQAIRFSGDVYVLFGLSSGAFWCGGPFLKGLFRERKSKPPK